VKCGYFDAGRCRSCAELATEYPTQLAAKEAQCRALLAHNATASLPRKREPSDSCGAVQWMPPVPSPEFAFRNKAKMVVSGSAQLPVLGILDAQGTGVDLSDCPLYPPALQAGFAPLADFICLADIAPYDLATRRGELKYLLITLAAEANELMVRFVLRSQEPVQRMRKHLAALQAALPSIAVVSANLQPVHAAVLEGEEELVLTPRSHIAMRLNGIPMHLGPRSFFQTNDTVAAALYRQAREWVDEIDPAALWDLFCGVGGFALHCADGRRQTTGIETSADAIASARRSAAELGLANLEFRALDATDFALGQTRVPPLVIVNPPRRGIGAALARFLDASGTRHVIYSSCNAESLARDLIQMPSFRLKRARVLDMFPHTRHYEVLTLLERGD
jgi:23S rRNA (uracil747-C5)-methyltransferase